MAVTLRDVALDAGVSVSVASRSFLDGSPVSPPTRARVLAAAKRLGYRRNRLAAGLTTGRTRLVALVTDEAADAPALRLLRAVSQGLQAQGLRPLLVHVEGSRERREALQALREYSVEAAVVVSSALPPAFAQALREDGVPVVHALARATGAPEGPQVALAETVAGREAARLLHARQGRRLGFVGGPEAAQPTRDRAAGFRNMAQRLGCEVRAAFMPAFTHADGAAAARLLLADGPLDGLFCADDRLAAGALTTLRAAGLCVPEEVGVLGAGGHEAGEWLGLSTLAPPHEALADATVALTLAALGGGPAPEPQRFELALLDRATMRAAPEARPRMAAAAR